MVTSCDRARLWAALAPDGALSEIEKRLLEGHLLCCESCRAFSTTVDAFVQELRLAPYESPPPFRLSGFRAPRSHLSQLPILRQAVQVVAIAAVAGVSVGLIHSIGSSDRLRTDAVPATIAPIILNDATSERDNPVFLRQLRDYRVRLGKSKTRHPVDTGRSGAKHPGPILG